MATDPARTALKLAALLTLATGVGVALLSMPVMTPVAQFIGDLFLPGAPVEVTPLARLFAAIAGGTLAGWGVMIWLAADRLPASQNGLLRGLVMPAILVWFVVDSAGSAASGSLGNVGANLLFLLVFAIPIVMLGQIRQQPA